MPMVVQCYGARKIKSAPPRCGHTMTRLARPIEQTNGLVGDIIASSFKLRKAKEEFLLEMKIKLPGGGTLEFKREPMGQGRFNTMCLLIGIFIVGSGLLKFFGLMV